MKTKYRVVGGCVLCLSCVYECPVSAIIIIEDVSVKIDSEKCIGCGKCRDNCQNGAIQPEGTGN